MESNRENAVWVGPTRDQEMCNYLVMYWVDGDKTLEQKSCSSLGPPIYYWDRWIVGGGLTNIPEDASKL